MRILLAVVALVIGFAAPAVAQNAAAPATPAASLDAAKTAIDAVEAALARGDLSDARLQALREDIDPVATRMQGIAGDLAPRIDAAKARLAQLGPKPAADAPREPPDVSAERASQEKLFNDLDATAKRARVLGVQARQIGDGITARRRAAFAHALFARSTSVLAPSLWIAVARELPADGRAAATLAEDWVTAAANRTGAEARAALASLLVLTAAICWPGWRLARHIRGRDPAATPTRFQRAAAALRVALATAVVPIAGLVAAGWLIDAFDLPNQLHGLGRTVTESVGILALVSGLARGYLAPKSPNWRLPSLSDEGARIAYHLIIAITAVVAVERVVEALNDFIAVALPTAVATRALGVVGVVLALVHALRRGSEVGRRQRGHVLSARLEHWVAATRSILWALIAILLGAVVAGYVAFAAFAVEQIIVAAVAVALLHLALVLVDDGIAGALESRTSLGRWLTVAIGLRAETLDQVAILVAGLVRVALFVAAGLVLLAPWRVGSGDMLATAEAAFFGFTVGDVTISLSTTTLAVLLFIAIMGTTRAVQGWLESKFLPRTKLDAGLRNSIRISLGYVGFTLALALALSTLGLGFERLAIVAGALSVGIGFGLQSVVNNFVSGLILLWERAIRVGDWIAVGEEQGYVRRINVRSTEIETFDRALLILPNSSLISGQVKNWVRNDRVGRIKVPFTLPLDAEPEEVRSILIAAAKAHDLVLAIPAPAVLFTALNEAGLRFDLLCFTGDVESSARVSSDLLYDIHARFKARGLVRAPAPPVVTSPALDKLDAWLAARVPDGRAGGTAPP